MSGLDFDHAREQEGRVSPYNPAKGGYEHALATGLLATNCCICGRPLLDADSVQRGYGPDCQEKYVLPLRMTGRADTGLMLQGYELAPQTMKAALTKVAPKGEWSDPEVRRRLVNTATFHAALAVSFGGNTKLTNDQGIDVSKLVIAAFQNIAMGAGYDALAKRLTAAFASRGQARDAAADIRIKYGSPKRDVLKLATPFSDQFNSAARGSKLFMRFEKEEGAFWRFFKTSDLGKVVNLLQSTFGDQLIEGPEGGLTVLPAVPVFVEPEPTPPAPPPSKENPTPEVKLPEEVRDIHVGDEVELPDGRRMPVSWVGMGRGEKRVAVGPKGRYEFFAMSGVKLMSPAAATAILEKNAAQGAADARKEGVTPEAVVTKVHRAVPATCFDYQIEGIRWLDEKGRGILADDMGLGKTLQSIIAIDAPAIVVCPAKLKVNWVREIAKWRSDLTTQLISGKKPVSVSELTADVVVINYDILAAHQEALTARKWKTIVFDEAQALKNLSLRYNKEKRKNEPYKDSPQLARAAYEIWRNIPRVFVLTGTPIMNRTKELWSLLHLVDPKVWWNFFPYGVRYCAGYEDRYGWNFNGRSNVAELHEKVNKHFMLRRMKVDVLKDLPEKSRFTMAVSLDEASAKKYKRAADDFIRWVAENGGPAAVERALLAPDLTELTALRRIAAEGKVEAALEWIWSFYDSRRAPLLVWGWHREPLERIAAALQKGDPEDENRPPLRVATILGGTSDAQVNKAKDAFQAGEIDVLLMSIRLGAGHTLTAASDALFIERAWRPSDLAQAEDRIYRIGTKNACQITYLDAEGTIDVAIAALLTEKAKTVAGVIDGKDLSEKEAIIEIMHSIFGTASGRVRNSATRRVEVEPSFSWNDPL